MRLWLLTSLGIALLGCRSTPQPNPSLFEEYTRIWSEQSACAVSWASLLDEWEQNGGGLKATIRETRNQIATDPKSRFAALVRAAWASQDQPVTADGPLEKL